MKDEILYKISRPVIKVLFNFLYRPTYIGRENIPPSGSFVLAGKSYKLSRSITVNVSF